MWTNTNDFYCLVNFKTGEMLSNNGGLPVLFPYFEEANSYIDEQEMWGGIQVRRIHLEMGEEV